MAVRLSREMIELIESGVSMVIGSRDDALRPECLRALGATVSPGAETVSVYLQAFLAGRTRANFETNGLVAVTFSRILDHYTVQLKGKVRSVREATAEDEAMSDRYLVAFAEQLALAGLPRSVVRRVRTRPGLTVEIEPQEIFLQTPGAGAGRRLEQPNGPSGASAPPGRVGGTGT